MSVLDFKRVNNDCVIIESESSFKICLQLINEFLEMDSIEIFLGKTPKSKNFILEQVEVKKAVDVKFIYPEKSFSYISQYIQAYESFLVKQFKIKEIPFDQKMLEAKKALHVFNIGAHKYNINNRFSFIRKDLFFTLINKRKQKLQFGNLIINESTKNDLYEMFKIRSEAYTHFASMTENYINFLEAYRFEFSKVKLTPKGEKLLTEFIIGISIDNTFVECEDAYLMQTEISAFFGLPSRSFTKHRDNSRRGVLKKSNLGLLEDKFLGYIKSLK